MNGFKQFKLYKRLLIYLLIFYGVNYVNSVKAQDKAFSDTKITLKESQITIEQAIKRVQSISGISIFYSNQLINGKEIINTNYESTPLKNVLDDLFNSRSLSWQYHQDKNTILVKPSAESNKKNIENDSLSLIKHSKIVKGKLLNEKSEPVIALIKIKGTEKAVTSNESGSFELENIKEDAVIQIQGINIQRKEFSLKKLDSSVQQTKDGNFIITLLSKVNELQNVEVNTGYQTINRERSAGSFSSVGGSEIGKKANLTGNILETLDGIVPGLSVNYGTGEDKFLIRGTTSVNSNRAPLIVVDGAIMEDSNIEDLINSMDIEDVTVLKDATAASIWGARSANGVIVITTKKGDYSTKKININYDGSFTYKGIPDLAYRRLMNSQELIQAAQEIFDPEAYKWSNITSWAGGALVHPHELPLYQFHNGEISLEERDKALKDLASYDNLSEIKDYFIQPSLFSKHALSFDGGTENYTFYGSINYEYNQQLENSKYNKYMMNLRQDFKITDWLKVDLTTNLTVQNNDNELYPQHTNWKSIFPYVSFTDQQGNPADHTYLVFHEDYYRQLEEESQLDLSYYPLIDMKEGFNTGKSLNGRVNLGIQAKLTKGLRYEGRFQYQQNYSKSELFNSQYSSRVREELAKFTKAGDPIPTYYLPTTGGRYALDFADGKNWSIRNQLSFDHEFPEEKSYITAIAGMEVSASLATTNGSTRRGYDPQSLTYQPYDEKALASPGITGAVFRAPNTLSNTLKTSVFSQTENDMRFVSFYSNLGYTYLNKYTLNGSVRADQSNLFGSSPSVQFKPIWSLGAAWNINNETFMDKVEWINDARLRFSYGYNGNSPQPGMGGPYNLLLSNTHVFFAGQGLGYSVMYPANDKIRWERTRVINTGLDLSLFNRRISTTFEVYNKLTTDLLSTIPVDQTLGWESYYGNLGDMKNWGFELSLASRNIVSPNFKWTSTLTMTHNKNKVLKLNMDGMITASKKLYFDFAEGYPGNSLFAYQWAGLNEEGNPQVYDSNGDKTVNTQDPNLTEAAVQLMGVTQPKWYGGLTNTFSYKNLDFSFLIVYNLGHKMRNSTNDFWYGRITRNITKEFADRWKEPEDELHTNTPKYVPLIGQNQNNTRSLSFYEMADMNVLDASYIKLRDFTVAYKLPNHFSERLSVKNISLRAQASNLFLIAANKEGIDPEFHQYRVGLRGTKYGPSWSLGLNVKF